MENEMEEIDRLNKEMNKDKLGHMINSPQCSSQDADLMGYMNDNFLEDPPTYIDQLKPYPHIQKLGYLLKDVIDVSQQKYMNVKEVEDINLAISIIIYETNRISSTNLKSSRSLDRVKTTASIAAPSLLSMPNQEEIYELKRELAQLRSENATLKSQQTESHGEVNSMIEEIDNLYQVKSKLYLQINQAKLAYEEELSKQRAKYTILEEHYNDLNSEIKSLKDRNNRLDFQLNQYIEDIKVQSNELNELKEKLTNKTTKITQMSTIIKKMKIQLDEKDFLVSSSNNVVQHQDKKTIQQLAKLNESYQSLVQLTQQQEQEINELKEANEKNYQETQDNFQYTQDLQDRIEEKEEIIQSLQSENASLKDELEQTQTHFENTKDNLYKLKQEFDDIKQAVKKITKSTGVSINQIPDYLIKLQSEINMQKDGQSQNICIINSFTKFLTRLFEKETIELPFLKGTSSTIVLEDPQVRIDVINSINQLRNTIQDDKTIKSDPFFDSIFGSQTQVQSAITRHISRGDYADHAVIIALCHANSKLQAALSVHNQNLMNVKKLIPDCEDDESIIASVTKYLKGMKPFISKLDKVLKTTLKYNGDTSDTFSLLNDFIDEMQELISLIDREIRPIIEYNGPLTGLPTFTHQFILDLQTELEETSKVAADEIEAIRAEFDQEKQELEKSLKDSSNIELTSSQITDYQEKLAQKEKEIESLKEQLEDALDARTDLEETFNTFHANNADYEAKCRVLLNERDRLNQIIEEKTKIFNERIESTRKFERQRTEEELRRMEKRMKDQQDASESQINESTQKLLATKKKLAELEQSYEASKQKKKDAIRQLIIQNQKLMHKLSKAKLMNSESPNKTETMLDSFSLSSTPINTPTKRFTQSLSSPMSAQASTPTTYDDQARFNSQITRILSRYTKQETGWTKSRILTTLNLMVDRLSHIDKNSAISSPSSSPVPKYQSPAQDFGWVQWAQNLLNNADQHLSPASLRSAISDLVQSSSNKSKFISIVHSLRYQKQFLLNHDSHEYSKTDKPIKMRGIVLSIVFLKLSHKVDRTPRKINKYQQ